MKGFILLDRELLEDPMYLSERFTRMQAFVDLCFLAEYKERVLFIRGNKVTLRRGQLAKSVHELSLRWRWSANTVTKFLKELKTGGYIDIRKTPAIHVITVKNYLVTGTKDDTKNTTNTDTYIETLSQIDDAIPELKKKNTSTKKKKSKDSSKSYAKLIKSPQWQKKRLEILERDGFKCVKCGCEDEALHVHHLYYKKETMPWDYPDDALITLCEKCHKAAHQNDNK